MSNIEIPRRNFVAAATIGGVGLAMAGIMNVPVGALAQGHEEYDVSPPEDLMREHGALDRLLLIYAEAARRLRANQSFDLKAVHSGAVIVRNFIENYHEKLEEDYLFPRFEKAGRHRDLVATLRRQHDAGRHLTARIIAVTGSSSTSIRGGGELPGLLEKFVFMYRPHAAREDTVLFPALREIVSRSEFDSLGEIFERREHELFGARGFESIVERIAQIEKSVGLYDLAQFTPS